MILFRKFDQDCAIGVVTRPISLKYIRTDILAWEHYSIHENVDGKTGEDSNGKWDCSSKIFDNLEKNIK